MNPFKEFRYRARYTQEKISELLETDRSTIAKWETGKSLPRADTLFKLAQLYRCTVEDLLSKMK